MSAIPEDIMQTAKKVCGDLWKMDPKFIDEDSTGVTLLCNAILAERKRYDIACQALIDEYVTAERARCANSVWDFYYGEKRGHVTPEEFAEFLQPKP